MILKTSGVVPSSITEIISIPVAGMSASEAWLVFFCNAGSGKCRFVFSFITACAVFAEKPGQGPNWKDIDQTWAYAVRRTALESVVSLTSATFPSQEPRHPCRTSIENPIAQSYPQGPRTE